MRHTWMLFLTLAVLSGTGCYTCDVCDNCGPPELLDAQYGVYPDPNAQYKVPGTHAKAPYPTVAPYGKHPHGPKGDCPGCQQQSYTPVAQHTPAANPTKTYGR